MTFAMTKKQKQENVIKVFRKNVIQFEC